MFEGRIIFSDVERDGIFFNESEVIGVRERRDFGVGVFLIRLNRLVV